MTTLSILTATETISALFMSYNQQIKRSNNQELGTISEEEKATTFFKIKIKGIHNWVLKEAVRSPSLPY